MAIGDINNDGTLDAVVTENGGLAHILLNKTQTGNHWLGIRLVGHKSNRDGIGAVIKLTTSAGPQWETLTTSVGYLSSSDPRVHFGLGKDTTAQSIEIRWPSGILQTLKDVQADQYVMVDEPVAVGATVKK
jgi:enediyne biosynthesis protein E4